jgi:hypothetical protein
MIHSFLMIGQSNMAGRGNAAEVAPIENESCFVLRNGIFRPMHYPVNFDRFFSGLNLCESFADAYQKENNVEVGLIPAADGGSSMDQWHEGEILFDHACYMAELASRTSEIKGILWHQGEADCSEALYSTYEARLTAMIEAMRKRLGMPDVPVLLGGLGDFLKDCPLSAALANYVHVNDALKAVASKVKNVGFVSAEGLGSNSDFLHFNSAALREFGLRYYEGYKALVGKISTESTEEKASIGGAASTKMELL